MPPSFSSRQRGCLSAPSDDSSRHSRRGGFGKTLVVVACTLAAEGTATQSASAEAKDAAAPQARYHLRINCGGPEVVDADGTVWHSDEGFAFGGAPFAFPETKDTKGVKKPAPQEVYQTVRHQDHGVMIRDIPAGHYRVRIHLVDAFPSADRHMDFHAQGKLVLDDINPYEIAGREVNRVTTRSFPVVVEAGQGLRIQCMKDRGNDVFQAAMEVIATKAPPPLNSAPTPDDASLSSRSEAILDLTSGREARLVWVQTDKPGDQMVILSGDVQIRGFATAGRDGQRAGEERLLVAGDHPIQKPLLSHDGSRVVFSNPADHSCHVVDWDSGERRPLGNGFVADIWRDPHSGLEWVYIALRSDDGTITYVRRRLDAPDQEEPLWQGLPAEGQIPWLQLSGDGRRAAEAVPWPKCGVIQLDAPGFRWKVLGNGCWPGMAPDDSHRFFLFQGNHTTLSVIEADAPAARTIAINRIAGLDGGRVYHPRWSNDARFLTVTGPQKSERTELYLGRFSEDFTSVEAWARVTFDDRADAYGDCWIAPAD